MSGRSPLRPTSIPSWNGRRVGALPALVVVLVVASLVATCAGPVPSPSSPIVTPAPSPMDSLPASGSPSATPGVTPLPSTPADTGWAPLDLPAVAEVARLEATRSGAAGVAPTTAFRLTSLDGTPVREMAARLAVTPTVELVVASITGTTAVLQPATALRQGGIYRLDLQRTDGTSEAAWAVQAASTLRVTSTIPSDETTGVPRDTGVEITFDQSGVTVPEFQARFSIAPRVDGRFEQHGRTFVFVPLKPLAPNTLYTVTVRHGLPLPGTGMSLVKDVIIRFETTGVEPSPFHVTVRRPLFDAATNERAAIALLVNGPDDEGTQPPATLSEVAITVHRLPGISAAIDAYTRVRAAPEWTIRSSSAPVGTGSLPLVLKGTFQLRPLFGDDESARWLQLPRTLPAGWYVVTITHAGLARQTVLQVTDLAVYAAISRTRSLVWVNNLRSNAAVSGARVTFGDTALGRTNARGLLLVRTPAKVLAAAGPGSPTAVIVQSDGKTVFLPTSEDEACYSCGSDQADRWWHILSTDRVQYRTTDTINVWGVLRDRDTGKVPASATLELRAQDWVAGAQPVVGSTVATPDRAGAWLGRLSFTDVPPGEYGVSVRIGSAEVGSQWVEIGPITKPAWQVSVSTPKHAVLTGTKVPITGLATFFEGTPVAGATLRLTSDYDTDNEEDAQSPPAPVLATTDVNGQASGSVKVGLGGDFTEQWIETSLRASANEPEEGEISGAVPVAVFASTAIVDSDATLSGTTLTMTGTVRDVAFARYDEPGATPWSVDPRGAPRARATVKLRVTETTPIVRQTGTRYDFVAKRTVPEYDVTDSRVEIAIRTVTTGADGTFRLSMSVKGGDRSYSVRAVYTDEAGRRIDSVSDASSLAGDPRYREPRLYKAGTTDLSSEYRVGDSVRVRFRGGIASPEVSRYLFYVTSRGLRAATVQGSPSYATRFTAALVPAADITAVRFTGTGYEVANRFSATLRTVDRRLKVALTPDRDAYQPGDRVTVAVRTLDAAGRPVAASVFVRAIDEKLFAIGAASLGDPLEELYAPTSSGLVTTAVTHVPADQWYGDGKGDTGGGDERSEFRDWLVARLVTTGQDGRASVSFDASDDLTSWRVIASAVTPALHAGQATLLVPVKLPFFADAIMAAEYLSADKPLVRVRAYGAALTASDGVTFRVSSDTLPMAAVTVQGKAFQPVEVALPTLTAGTHRLRIEASTGSGAGRRMDTLVRTFRVVETRAIRSHTESVALAAGTTVGGGTGMTSVTLVDAGRGRVVPLLRELSTAEPFRADRALAAAIARRLLADEFGIPDDPGLPDPDIAPFLMDGGLALLPYASADLELSALAALSGDPRLSPAQLRTYFHEVVDNSETPITRDRLLWALVGRAAVGDATIAEVAEAAALSDLTPTERVTVALAAVAIGDDALARGIERELLTKYGERLGPWVRVNVGTSEATAATTARLAIVAAALGDPIAAEMDAEVAAHPPKDTLVDLERAIAAGYWANRMPKATAVAAVTVDGTRTERTITGDRPVVFDVTPAQRAGLRIDPVSGSVLVISQWDGPVAAGDLRSPAGQTIVRTVTPAGAIGATDRVVVSFEVTLGADADDGCWRVTDFAPSGLVPVPGANPRAYQDGEGDGPIPPESPWSVIGQRVDFCAWRDPQRPVMKLQYVARVVGAGTYRWEPAVLQSSIVQEQGVVLPSFDVTVRGLGS